MRRLLPWLAVAAAGCLTAEQADTRFEDWLVDHRACEVEADCTLVYPGCPLGCASAVATEHLDAAEALADDLIRRYELGGRACAYDCIQTPDPVCADFECVIPE